MAVKRKQAPAAPPPPKPQFFKILLPCSLQTLRLPEGLNKYIVGEMPRKATILSPLGRPWNVEVHSSTTDHSMFLYFGEGWQEFSQAHDLEVGFLVLFTYEGDMVFTATIFDRTTFMREYVQHSGEGNNKVEDHGFSCCNNVLVKKKPIGRPGPVPEALRERSLAEILSSAQSQKHNPKVASCGEGSQYFEIVINSYKPCEEPSLLLPPQFAKYLSEKKGTLATIFSPIGNAWHIKVHEDGKGFHFADGWQRFAQTHNLRRGDLLGFKHHGDLLFDVKIFGDGIVKREYCNLEVSNARFPTEEETSEEGLEELQMPLSCNRVAKAMEPTNCNVQVGSAKMEESADQKAPDIVNGSARISHFELVINLSTPCRRCAFELPAKFIASNGLHMIQQLFLRDPNGQLWPVRICHRQGQKFRATGCAGWRAFCVGNDVRNGDTCLFQLEGKDELHVKIHRKKHQKAMKASRGLEELQMPLSCNRVAKAVEPTNVQDGSVRMEESAEHGSYEEAPDIVNRKARISHFERVINLPTPCRRYALELPAKFIASNGLHGIEQLFLRDPNGQLWPVRISHRRGQPCRATGCAGWRDFCIGNNVRNGDICLFQLEGKNELHVKIHRRNHQKAKKLSRAN